jgi:hypothetical protein
MYASHTDGWFRFRLKRSAGTPNTLISPWTHQLPNGEPIQLYMIDTPGFDDTYRGDEEILRRRGRNVR